MLARKSRRADCRLRSRRNTQPERDKGYRTTCDATRKAPPVTPAALSAAVIGSRRGRIDEGQSPRQTALDIHRRQHSEAAAGVVVAVEPGEGEEVRNLPHEENTAENPSAGVELSR